MLKLAERSVLSETLNDKGKVPKSLVRKLSVTTSNQRTGRVASLLGDELTRIYAPILLRSLVIQSCNADLSYQLGACRVLCACLNGFTDEFPCITVFVGGSGVG